MTVTKPMLDAPDDDWNKYSRSCNAFIMSALHPFLVQQFGYSDRFVKRYLNLGAGPTINAYTLKYDIYLRLFPTPRAGWPRETLVIARIGFKNQRKGHGRNLLSLLAGMATEIGYHQIGIESTNEESRAFGKRYGLKPLDQTNNWIGTVDEIQRALAQSKPPFA